MGSAKLRHRKLGFLLKWPATLLQFTFTHARLMNNICRFGDWQKLWAGEADEADKAGGTDKTGADWRGGEADGRMMGVAGGGKGCMYGWQCESIDQALKIRHKTWISKSKSWLTVPCRVVSVGQINRWNARTQSLDLPDTLLLLLYTRRISCWLAN